MVISHFCRCQKSFFHFYFLQKPHTAFVLLPCLVRDKFCTWILKEREVEKRLLAPGTTLNFERSLRTNSKISTSHNYKIILKMPANIHHEAVGDLVATADIVSNHIHAESTKTTYHGRLTKFITFLYSSML